MIEFEFFKNFKETPLKKKLRLPKKFVMLYGETLSNEVFLKPTRGFEIWKIGLIKSEGKVWLKQGWPVFAKRYALGDGRLVFFRYEGNSEFAVSVCDNRKSATQIYCSPNPSSASETELIGNAEVPGVPGIDYDNAIEISNGSSLPWSDEEVESPQKYYSTCRRMRTRSSVRCKRRIANSTDDEDSVGSNSEFEGKQENPSLRRGKKAKVQKWRQFPTPNEKDKALSSDSGHESSNPRFVIAIKPSHIDRPAKMVFPIVFWREHLNGRDGKVILYGSHGAAWTVHISMDSLGAFPRPIFRSGWKKFVQNNNLVVGDICTFKLINTSEISFKVAISRSAADYYSRKLSSGEFKNPSSEDCKAHLGCFHGPYCPFEHQRACEEAGKFSSRFPFFKIILGRTLSYQIEVGKNSWPVRLLKSSSGYSLSGGFIKFLSENSVGTRDVCIFELIKDDPVTLKATTFKYDML